MTMIVESDASAGTSTATAERVLIEANASRRRRAAVIDKVAATVILQNALDRMRHRSAP